MFFSQGISLLAVCLLDSLGTVVELITVLLDKLFQICCQIKSDLGFKLFGPRRLVSL